MSTAAARHLSRVPRIVASTDDVLEVLRRSAELVAEAVRADAVLIRLGIGGAEAAHTRRPWGELPADLLPTRLATPLVLRGRRLGVLTAVRARRRPFPQGAVALVAAFAGPIAMAVDNARLYDALQDRLADVSRLAEASEAIAALGDLGTVGEQITRYAAHLVGAERAALVTPDAATGRLTAQKPGFGLAAAELAVLHADTTDADILALAGSGRPFISNDVQNERRPLGRSARLLGERSVLIVPLRAADRTPRLLRVSNKEQGLFTQQDARLLSVFAAQAAVALDNATLYETAVREREQLKEVERLKSQFLSLVSHELRTPLSSIKASAEVLLSTAPEDTLPAHLRLLRNIDRAGERLSALITDLLDLARMEGGRLDLHAERLDLRHVVDDAVATVRPLADEWRQRIRLCQATETCPVTGDRRRLEQIILNLLTNAIKYGPPDGNIWLTVGEAPDGRPMVTVRDEGPGISADEQPRVFERFYRIDVEQTRRATGTGLGLPIAKALAELHGGALELQSEPDRGSTFSLTLPKAFDEDPDRRR